jgi:hypothetical protein
MMRMVSILFKAAITTTTVTTCRHRAAAYRRKHGIQFCQI